MSPKVSLHVCRRRAGHTWPTIPSQHLFESGDPAFDARHVAYDFDPDEGEKAHAMTLLHDVAVQRVTRELLDGDSDDCLLGHRMYVSRRRDGLDLGELADRVAAGRAPRRGRRTRVRPRAVSGLISLHVRALAPQSPTG